MDIFGAMFFRHCSSALPSLPVLVSRKALRPLRVPVPNPGLQSGRAGRASPLRAAPTCPFLPMPACFHSLFPVPVWPTRTGNRPYDRPRHSVWPGTFLFIPRELFHVKPFLGCCSPIFRSKSPEVSRTAHKTANDETNKAGIPLRKSSARTQLRPVDECPATSRQATS
jgi:hypothetical protein